MASKTGGEALSIIKRHFTLTANEISKAYQSSYGYALAAIRLGVAAPEQNLLQKIRHSKITREFASQIEQLYLQPFVKQYEGVQNFSLATFREPASQALKTFAKFAEKIFEIQEITEEDLAALISYQETLAITDVVLAQMHSIAPVDETLAAFLRYEGLLGHAVLFFFRELLRQDPRLEATQTALQQAKLCLEVRNLQAQLQTTEDNIVTALKDHSPNLVELAQQRDHLQQVQTAWQTHHEPLLRFANRFESWHNEIVAWAKEVYVTLDKIEGDVEDTKRLVQENARKLDQLLAQRGLSSQVSPRDGFIQYDNDSLQLIWEQVAQLKRLPSQHPEYAQMSMKLGSVLSSTGDLVEAEQWFQQGLDKADNDDGKAEAYFNIFQVRWRQAFTAKSPADKAQDYANALTALQAAIKLSNGRFALHDINIGYYPILKMLGAGGMGCALLCENHNFMIKGHQQVVVKCFWENLSGSLEQVFNEPFAMHDIAGDYVPKTPISFVNSLNIKYNELRNKRIKKTKASLILLSVKIPPFLSLKRRKWN
jgi:tetratricopeptide (TPR) repeat protein